MTSNKPSPTPPKAGIWPYVPVGLLGAMLVGLGTLGKIAIDDPHFAVEKDYYQKAVAWDQTRVQQVENERLGWDVTLRAEGRGDRVELIATLVDGKGLAVSGAAIDLEAFPNAFAGERATGRFETEGSGRYRTSLPNPRPGLWEIRLNVSHDGSRFTQTVRLDLPGDAT